jgi:alkylglycerol monooxygenase
MSDAIRTKRWRDKFAVWFRRTGWRPADVELRYPKDKVDLEAFRKYDPPVSTGVRRYVIGQLLAAIVAVLLIAYVYATGGVAAAFIPCLLLWALLYTMGILNEGRGYAVAAEVGRLAVLTPVGVYLYAGQGFADQSDTRLWLALALYCALSMAWLLLSNRSIPTVKTIA